jgi:prolyl-tRNA synthetase
MIYQVLNEYKNLRSRNIYISSQICTSMGKKTTVGMSVKKADQPHEWFTEVIAKAELIEYTGVSGCYIFRPWSYAIWEHLQSYIDSHIKALGVVNAYFPLFIPEHLLTKEAEHVEGFAPEVAWVTHHGNTALKERLAIRPTSETIMYEAYSKWIRSHRDLPLRINQWANVVRWEFNNPQPFLRSREFLWQEGHTAFATKEEADKEVHQILDLYEQTYRDLFAVPSLKGLKSEKEKFAGADYTTSVELFLPIGKAIQGATSHALGQNFGKAFDISFVDEHEQHQHPWQNSWGITTRSIGAMIFTHGDDKGLVLPPRVAPIQVVFVPIWFEKNKDQILDAVHAAAKSLRNTRVHVDDRPEHTPGFKFNHWELKGVPIRIEIGPKDLEKQQAVLVRRDTGKKSFVKLSDLQKEVESLLDTIQSDLYTKAKKYMDDSIVTCTSLAEATKAVKDNMIAFAPWCGARACEEEFKAQTGAKSLNSPFKQEQKSEDCFACQQKAEKWTYFAKSL